VTLADDSAEQVGSRQGRGVAGSGLLPLFFMASRHRGQGNGSRGDENGDGGEGRVLANGRPRPAACPQMCAGEAGKGSGRPQAHRSAAGGAAAA
jgi:hypothetical protein